MCIDLSHYIAMRKITVMYRIYVYTHSMYQGDIRHLAKENEHYRKVLYTGPYAQLVLMCLQPGQEIGEEVHSNSDQLLFFVDGDKEVEVIINGEPFWADEHGVVYVPSDTKHTIINKGSEKLKMYTVYAPSVHPDGLVQTVKPLQD